MIWKIEEDTIVTYFELKYPSEVRERRDSKYEGMSVWDRPLVARFIMKVLVEELLARKYHDLAIVDRIRVYNMKNVVLAYFAHR